MHVLAGVGVLTPRTLAFLRRTLSQNAVEMRPCSANAAVFDLRKPSAVKFSQTRFPPGPDERGTLGENYEVIISDLPDECPRLGEICPEAEADWRAADHREHVLCLVITQSSLVYTRLPRPRVEGRPQTVGKPAADDSQIHTVLSVIYMHPPETGAREKLDVPALVVAYLNTNTGASRLLDYKGTCAEVVSAMRADLLAPDIDCVDIETGWITHSHGDERLIALVEDGDLSVHILPDSWR
jgi:hypothetical protein